MARIEIENYRLTLGQGTNSFLGQDHGRVAWTHSIMLTGQNWQIFVYFVPDGTAHPKAFQSQTIQRFFAFLPSSRYSEVVDMLRNEAPVFASFGSRDGAFSLHTEFETVGEGECCPTVLPKIEDNSPDEPSASDRGYAPFEETVLGHRYENAYLCALASHYVYADDSPTDGPGMLDWFSSIYDPWLTQRSGSGTPRYDFINDENGPLGSGFQAVVMSNDHFILMAIRGTKTPFGTALNPLIDWMNNLTFLPLPAPELGPVHLHSGWLLTARRVMKTIRSKLAEHRGRTNKPIWITGHSLGGAMSAIIGAMLAQEEKLPVQGIYTFAAPPVGDALYLNAVTANGIHFSTHRWVNDRDPAPYLNKLPGMFGSFHAGNAHFITSDGTPMLDTNTPLIPPVPLEPTDHAILNYARQLREELPVEVRQRVPEMP